MIGGNPEGEEQTHHGYEVDILERSCRASIDRLQCEYIDLYQLHFPSRDTPVFGCASFYPGVKDNPNRSVCTTLILTLTLALIRTLTLTLTFHPNPQALPRLR
eukprot:scaffold11320_cov46-Phaeocystis_antarctica.AAC.1